MIKVAIVGGGFYGMFLANQLQHRCCVSVIDNRGVSATRNCQARLHSGLFYVRNKDDLLACAKNGPKFYKLFRKSIIKDFDSYYLVDKDSPISLDEYMSISKANKLHVKKTKLDYVNMSQVQGVLKAKEFSIDTGSVMDSLHEDTEFIDIRGEVTRVVQSPLGVRVFYKNLDFGSNYEWSDLVDKVILCAYGNNNDILINSGLTPLQLTKQKIDTFSFEDTLPGECHAVVDGNYWNSMVTKSYKLLTNGIKADSTEKQWENSVKQVKQYIPEIEMYYRGVTSFNKFTMPNTRRGIVSRYGQVYTVFAGKLTNIFDIINQIEEI